jgi:hypothetical protein
VFFSIEHLSCKYVTWLFSLCMRWRAFPTVAVAFMLLEPVSSIFSKMSWFYQDKASKSGQIRTNLKNQENQDKYEAWDLFPISSSQRIILSDMTTLPYTLLTSESCSLQDSKLLWNNPQQPQLFSPASMILWQLNPCHITPHQSSHNSVTPLRNLKSSGGL